MTELLKAMGGARHIHIVRAHVEMRVVNDVNLCVVSRWLLFRSYLPVVDVRSIVQRRQTQPVVQFIKIRSTLILRWRLEYMYGGSSSIRVGYRRLSPLVKIASRRNDDSWVISNSESMCDVESR